MRIYKTRSDAAEACRTNKVLIAGSPCKPSREVKLSDIISVKRLPVTYSFKILGLVSSRQPAKNVAEYAENITPQGELDKLNIPKETIFIQRERGTGRPTKRERRDIDSLMDELYEEEDLD